MVSRTKLIGKITFVLKFSIKLNKNDFKNKSP